MVSLKYPLSHILIIGVTFVMLPGHLFAQQPDVSELTKQIEALLGTVAGLQTQLNTLQGKSGVGASVSFTRNLKRGDIGNDVRDLQVFLNKDVRTRIISFGDGSPGNETQYFGPLTERAVITFQELYTDDVLLPASLSSGSGYVGPLTRAKIHALLGRSGTIAEETATLDAPQYIQENETAPEVVFQDYEDLYLFFPSSYEVVRGESVTIMGAGFTREHNTVYINSAALLDISSHSGTSIDIIIPNTLPFGRHNVTISNAKGTSRTPIFIIVTEDQSKRPTIATSTPASGTYGQTVTIIGTNFLPSGNDIRTSYGIIENVSSPDGTTLSFDILPFPEIPQLQVGVSLNLSAIVPLTFYVLNKNGLSQEYGMFDLEL